MGFKLITPPLEEPITLAEAKEHLRVLSLDEDALIGSLITAARQWCEGFQNTIYLTQTWLLTFDEWPTFPIELSKSPLQSVTKIEYIDENSNATIWDQSNYIIDNIASPGRVALKSNYNIPSITLQEINGVQITFVAGHTTSDDVSGKVKAAMKLLISHWYENREAVVVGNARGKLQFAVDSLLWQDRVMPV